MSVIKVSPWECPHGLTVHDKHRWSKSLLGAWYECDGLNQRDCNTNRVLRAGSAGTLTQEQTDRYLAGLDPFDVPEGDLLTIHDDLIRQLAVNLDIPLETLRAGLRILKERR